jgi:hypothetical protein
MRERQLASPWGDIVLQHHDHRWVIDLFSAPKDVCKAIHLRADKIRGIARIAATGAVAG